MENNAEKTSDNVWDEDDQRYMREALLEAQLALDEGEVPVGCVLVDKSSKKVVARGHNNVNATCNPTRHAEFEALDSLKGGINSDDDIRMYVTCEPCGMCAAALRFAGVVDVIYGCSNDRFGGCGTVTPAGIMPLFAQPIDGAINGNSLSIIPRLQIRAGLFAEESVKLLQSFYKQDNLMAPPDKRKRKQ